eukprot:9495199-Pyramimonas_sp.AAC.1
MYARSFGTCWTWPHLEGWAVGAKMPWPSGDGDRLEGGVKQAKPRESPRLSQIKPNSARPGQIEAAWAGSAPKIY